MSTINSSLHSRGLKWRGGASRRRGLMRVDKWKRVLAEQAFQQTGCTSQECAVRPGKLLNVRRIVVGNCGKLLGTYFVSIRVVGVETGQATYADQAKGATPEAIEGSVAGLSLRMAAAAP